MNKKKIATLMVIGSNLGSYGASHSMEAAADQGQWSQAEMNQAIRLSLNEYNPMEESVFISEGIGRSLYDLEQKEQVELDSICAISLTNYLRTEQGQLQEVQKESVDTFFDEIDPETAAAIALSLQQKEEEIKEPVIEIKGMIYDRVGEIINMEVKKIEEEFPAYAKAINDIDNFIKSKEYYVGQLDSYNRALAVFERARRTLFNDNIKPRLDALNIHQIIMNNIPGLSQEQVTEILETLGWGN